MQCKATKSDKTPCRAHAMHEGDYCYRHNKEMAKQAARASSEGGKARRQYHSLGKSMKIETPDDIKLLIAEAINKLRTGQMHTNNPANSLGYLSKVFLEAHEKSSIEIRMAALEERLNQVKL